MRISLAEAESQWADLVRRAEAGDEIILTRDGRPAAKLVAIEPDDIHVPATREQKRAALEAAREVGRSMPKSEISAARSQDFLYDEDGLPG